jgi:hypothetical protein
MPPKAKADAKSADKKDATKADKKEVKKGDKNDDLQKSRLQSCRHPVAGIRSLGGIRM